MKMLKKDSIPSENRIWYNKWVKYLEGTVLDVGKSRFWDYGFPTIDINKELNPTFCQDICHSNLSSNFYDTILCNGMWECVDDPQKMVDEVYRLLKPEGIAIFGFVGKDYYPYKKNWKYYDNNIDWKKFKIIEKKDFDNRYYFIIARK